MDSLLTLILAVTVMAFATTIRRAAVWQAPLIVYQLLVGASAVVGLWGEPELRDWGLAAIIYALAIQVSPLFTGLSHRWLVQGRYRAAWRAATLDMILLPTARTRLMRLAMKTLHELKAPNVDRDALAARLRAGAQRAQQVGAAAPFATLTHVAALLGLPPRAGERLQPSLEAQQVLTSPPLLAGERVTQVLCDAQRPLAAAPLVVRMNRFEQVGPLTEAYRNRSRIHLLAALGETERVTRLLAPGSGLRKLFTRSDIDTLVTRAASQPRIELPTRAAPSEPAWARTDAPETPPDPAEPVSAEPSPAEQVVTERAAVEQAAVEQAAVEQAAVEQAAVEQAAVEQAAVEPLAPDPVAAEATGSAWRAELDRYASARSGFDRPTASITALSLVLVAIHVIAGFWDLRSSVSLMRLGAFVPELAAGGEYWRAWASTFLHGGYAHLLLNTAILLFLANQLASFFGQATVLLIYLVSGLAGSVAVGLFSDAHLCVGASGAVFGLMGALLAAVRTRPDVLPVSVARRTDRFMVVLLISNLALGAWVEFIALSAHMGGAVAGGLTALAILRMPRPLPWRLSPAGIAGVAAIWVGLTAWSVVGVAGALQAPAGALVPRVAHSYALSLDDRGRAQISLEIPTTWVDVSHLEPEWTREHGPTLIDASGGLRQTDFLCASALRTPPLPVEDVGIADLEPGDADGLARVLAENTELEFQPGPAGFAIRETRREDAVNILVIKRFETGRLAIRFVFEGGDASGRTLVEALLPTIELDACSTLGVSGQ